MKVLFVHSGGTKTGSSALQNFLASQAEALRGAGIAYQGGPTLRSSFDITSGNGQPLIAALRQGTDQEVREIVRAHFGDLDRAICSSEHLEYLEAPLWSRLLDLTGDEGISVHVVHFVRHIVPLIVSSYDQVVKRHGEYRPIEVWAEAYDLRMFSFLRNIASLQGRLSLTVLSYDQHRSDLASTFLRQLGLEGGDLAASSSKQTHQVNRSLSRTERDLLRHVNSLFGDAFSQEISDRFIALAPERPADRAYGAELVAVARKRYADEIHWVNDTYFGDDDVVRLESEPAPAMAEEDGAPYPAELLLGWSLDKIAQMRKQPSEVFVRHLLKAQEAQRPDDPRLPADFDPLIYLLHNRDLINGKVDPYKHFLNHGLREGRRYR